MPNFFKLPLSFDAERLKADFDQILPGDWVSHFNTRYYEGDWSGVALRSVGGVASQLYPDPAASKPFADTTVLERCPNIRRALAEFKCPLNSVRLLRLGPGSSIREHKDYNLSLEDGEIGIHIPITTNPLVNFFLNDERLVMEEGECWYLNLNLPHRVENSGATDRIHLVLHCAVDDWVRGMITSGADQIERRDSSPDATPATMSPEEGLERFRQLVLQDLALQEALREKTNWEFFMTCVVRLGRERGCEFAAEDVEAALKASRRAWITRWV